jgi:complex III assembly factor LYRM7
MFSIIRRETAAKLRSKTIALSRLSSSSSIPEGLTRQDAVHGFRRLLRSAVTVFGSDVYAVQAARAQLKEEFRKQSHVTEVKELKQLFAGIEEVDEMLRFNIVQGSLNERGNYDVDLTREETRTVLEAGKDLPLGVEMNPVDKSILGDASQIKIDKTSGSGKVEKVE